MMAGPTGQDVSNAARSGVDREVFLIMMVDAFNEILSDTVGQREVEGFTNLVGMAVSERVLARYRAAAGSSRLDLRDTLDAILDWKRKLGADFRILEMTDTKVVLVNGRCPFAGLTGDPARMCKITSHVFGHMIAESQGYGRVALAETIARGSRGCRVVIDLDPEPRDGGGQSYYARGGD